MCPCGEECRGPDSNRRTSTGIGFFIKSELKYKILEPIAVDHLATPASKVLPVHSINRKV